MYDEKKFDEFDGSFLYFPDIKEDDDDQLFEDNGTESTKFVLATIESTNEKVICKVFNPDVLKEAKSDAKTDQCWYRQFMLFREIKILKNLNHPTIVKFKGMCLFNFSIKFESSDFMNENNPTIFLEYLPNKSIQSHIVNNKLILPPVKRQIIMIGLAASVRFLHERNIIHRSLNPNKIWLDENFYPKIFDFGTSREFSKNNDTPATFMKDESVNYMAPEQIDNDNYNNMVDIFSLGRLFYLLITGCVPFKMEGDKNADISKPFLKLKITQKVEPMLPNGLSKNLEKVLQICCSHNPSDRPKAAKIYEFIKNEKCFIDGITSPNDLKEIQDYVKSIEDFEKKELESKFKLSQSFEIPLIDDS